MNLDIFAVLRKLFILRGFNFAFFIVFPLNCIVKVVFMPYICSQTFKKREVRKNMYNA